MDRRKFLKLLAATSFTAVFAPLSFARTLPRKILIAVKAGKYPGKIKPINAVTIRKVGKWQG